MRYILGGGNDFMKTTKAAIFLVVAIALLLFPTSTAIVEHIKQETVERIKAPSKPPVLQSSLSEDMPDNISTESSMDQSDQTQFIPIQFVPVQTSLPGRTGQEQIGGDYQAGYAAGYQSGYSEGWWDGVQATVQILFNYINSLQDTNMVMSEFENNGIIHPGGPTIQEGPKIKQAIDA